MLAAGGVEDPARSFDVLPDSLRWLCGELVDVRRGGEVEDNFSPGQRGVERRVDEDVADQVVSSGVSPPVLLVDHHNVMVGGYQVIDDVGADETAASGHGDAQAGSPGVDGARSAMSVSAGIHGPGTSVQLPAAAPPTRTPPVRAACVAADRRLHRQDTPRVWPPTAA